MIAFHLKTDFGELKAKVNDNNRLMAAILVSLEDLIPEYIQAITRQEEPSSSSETDDDETRNRTRHPR